MSELVNLQAAFWRALNQQDPKIQTQIMSPVPNSAPQRLAIYARAYFNRLHNALLANFPILATSLSPAEFSQLASAYIQDHPSPHYALQNFGQQLPEFLRKKDFFAGAIYHAEIATLDLTILHTSYALDQVSLSAADLQKIAPPDWHKLNLNLHPSVSLLQLDSNVLELWIAQQLISANFSRVEAPQYLIFWRQELSNYYRKLSSTEYQALLWLTQQHNFGALCLKLAADDSTATTLIAAFMAQWLQDQILCLKAEEPLKKRIKN